MMKTKSSTARTLPLGGSVVRKGVVYTRISWGWEAYRLLNGSLQRGRGETMKNAVAAMRAAK